MFYDNYININSTRHTHCSTATSNYKHLQYSPENRSRGSSVHQFGRKVQHGKADAATGEK